jgi:phosphoglucomutase
VGVDGVVGVALGVGGKVSAGAGHVRAEGVAWQGQSRSC